MARRQKRSWPGTPAELRDRACVVALVKRVGKNRLMFTTDDIRSEMNEVPGLRVIKSGELWRHLEALSGDLIEEAGRRDFGGAASSRDGNGRKKWMLCSRRCEPDEPDAALPLELHDLERVHLAVWVAVRALKMKTVPTRAVTEVLKNIEPLTLTNPRQTYHLLTRLESRSEPAVRKAHIEGKRWCRWAPLNEPDHPHFSAWVKEFREQAASNGGGAPAGRASTTEVARELVLIGIRKSKSSTYPLGTPVSLKKLSEVAGAVPEAGILADSIRRRRGTFSQKILDASREVMTDWQRVNVRIARVKSPLRGTVRYDVPDEPGFAHRRLILQLWDLRQALYEGVLERLNEDTRAAGRLPEHYPRSGHELQTLIAARVVLNQREFEALDSLLIEVSADEALFSKKIREEIGRHRSTLNDFLMNGFGSGEEHDILEGRLADLKLDMNEVVNAPRVYVTPAEYSAYFSSRELEGQAIAAFKAFSALLRRFPSPTNILQSDRERLKPYSIVTDRAESLPYAAGARRAMCGGMLACGARLLGRNLRSPDLVRSLANSDDLALRRDTMAALFLLKDPQAEDMAHAFLSCSASAPDTVAASLWVLHLAGSLIPEVIPTHVRQSQDHFVGKSLRAIMLARHQNRMF